MARVEKTIEVAVPVRTAYNQWTQFESFPQFMDGVEEVRQLDDTHLRWRAKVGGKTEEWEAVIREQVPDQKVIWQNTTGKANAGMVKFDALGPSQTRVHLEMSYDPEGFVESVGDALGFVSRRVEGDLMRFKDFIESRGVESGGWRGMVRNEAVPGGHTRGSLDAGEADGASPGDVDDHTRHQRPGPMESGTAGVSGPVISQGPGNQPPSQRGSAQGGDIASGGAAMRGTSSTGAGTSDTGSGYTAEGMTGQGGGSMQGGASTSYGNPGARSGTMEGSHSHHFAGQEGESPSTPTMGGSGEHTSPGGMGGEYPEGDDSGTMRSREDRGGMGGEYPERGSR